jgi:hypothetical protein
MSMTVVNGAARGGFPQSSALMQVRSVLACSESLVSSTQEDARCSSRTTAAASSRPETNPSSTSATLQGSVLAPERLPRPLEPPLSVELKRRSAGVSWGGGLLMVLLMVLAIDSRRP